MSPWSWLPIGLGTLAVVLAIWSLVLARKGLRLADRSIAISQELIRNVVDRQKRNQEDGRGRGGRKG